MELAKGCGRSGGRMLCSLGSGFEPKRSRQEQVQGEEFAGVGGEGETETGPPDFGRAT